MAALTLLCSSCGPDKAPKETPATKSQAVDANQSGQPNTQSIREGNPEEIVRSLNSSHQMVFKHIGGHRFKGTSSVSVHASGVPLEAVNSKALLTIDSKGQFYAKVSNEHGYGRDAHYVDGNLYLRPGVGKYHKRLPNSKQEPIDIREQIFSDLAGYFEIFAGDVEFSAKGDETTAERSSIILEITKTPTPSDQPTRKYSSPNKNWRNTVSVTKAEGTVHIDKASGVPLAVEFSGQATFNRGGRDLTMDIRYNHKIEGIDAVKTLTVPNDAKAVSSELESSQIERRQERLDELSKPKKPSSQKSGPTN